MSSNKKKVPEGINFYVCKEGDHIVDILPWEAGPDMPLKEWANECACENQIIWFFEKPTIIVCENCEITHHYSDKKCKICGGKLTEFVKKDELE